MWQIKISNNINLLCSAVLLTCPVLILLLFGYLLATIQHIQFEDATALNAIGAVEPTKFEFWLEVSLKQTLFCDESNSTTYYDIDGQRFCQLLTTHDPLNQTTPCVPCKSHVIVGDGVISRPVLAINGTLTGPVLRVLADSIVTVHVRNLWPDGHISIHFHGLTQKGTFYMDGVGQISQCPIGPDEEFTYVFQSGQEPGTYFYHGHTGEEMGDGVLGSFIVLPRHQLPQTNASENTPDYLYGKNDVVAVYMDWREVPFVGSLQTRLRVLTRNITKPRRMMSRDFVGQSVATKSKNMYWESALINGNGWLSADDFMPQMEKLPIERFDVVSSSPVRLRLINAAATFQTMVHVTGHRLRVISSDGRPMQETVVDKIILSPGERYDAYLEKRLGLSERFAAYAIQFRTIEKFDMKNFTNLENEFSSHTTYALLVYDWREGEKIRGVQIMKYDRACDRTEVVKNRCKVLNCAWQRWPGEEHDCINIDDMQGTTPIQTITSSISVHTETYFLNLYHEDEIFAVNGITFDPPSHPPFYSDNEHSRRAQICEPDCGISRDDCKCFNTLSLDTGKVIDLVVTAVQVPKTHNDQHNMGHPFHLHGHTFYVMKVGWPHYNTTNGLWKHGTNELLCSAENCNFATWKNATESTKGFSKNPVAKDTVFIPAGSYVVLRFITDNHGYWLAHCHVVTHHVNGMAILIKEGDPKLEDVPEKFRNCKNSNKIYHD